MQIIQTLYIQFPFLCRVSAGTRHMNGSTVDLQNRMQSPHPKADEKTLPKFPTTPHTQPKENVNETSICIQINYSVDVVFEYFKNNIKENKCVYV